MGRKAWGFSVDLRVVVREEKTDAASVFRHGVLARDGGNAVGHGRQRRELSRRTTSRRRHATRYAINLTVVPDQETFAGKVVIDVKLAKTTDLIWLKPARPRALAGRCNG